MKRDKNLHSLSWGHQHGLAFAHRLQSVLKGKKSGSLQPFIDEVLTFWRNELHPHFLAEEEILFPAVRKTGGSCNVEIKQTLNEHIQMAGLIQMMTQPGTSDEIRNLLLQFSSLLNQHIRFEERTLFPKIEKTVPESEMNILARELANRLPTKS
jgi:iron-sulfur cluster repair protein YtfE (RIC family)